MFELSLSKPPTKEASPATARQARHTTEKYSLLFSFCARRIFLSSNEKSIFLWCSAPESRMAGLASIFCEGKAEFPPHPPSATPSLERTEFSVAALFSYFLSSCFFQNIRIKYIRCLLLRSKTFFSQSN